MNLLKAHEEILERLTEVASKETKFEERGQFMNIQKMIREELGIIEKLKEDKIVEFTNVNKSEMEAYSEDKTSLSEVMKYCFIGTEHDKVEYPNILESHNIITVDVGIEDKDFQIVYSTCVFDSKYNKRVVKCTDKIDNLSSFEVTDTIFKMANKDTRICLNFRGLETAFVNTLISKGLGLVDDFKLHNISIERFNDLKLTEIDGCNKCLVLNAETSDSDNEKCVSLFKNIKDMNLLIYNVKANILEEFKHIKRSFKNGRIFLIEDRTYDKSSILTIREFNSFCDRLISLKQNDINAYELGVGKILIGQRGSGVTSTLIDECIKYDRPLLFKTQRQADLFKGQYPTLDAYCYDSMEDIGGYSAKEVCVELLMYNPNKDLIDKELEKIRHRVESICTVGVSHDNSNNESDKFMHIVNR